jgi:hypothetical protein
MTSMIICFRTSDTTTSSITIENDKTNSNLNSSHIAHHHDDGMFFEFIAFNMFKL